MTLKFTYVRAKRGNSIVYLCIEPKQSLDEIKTELCRVVDNKLTSEEVRFYLEKNNSGEYQLVEDSQVLKNDDVVYYVYSDNEGVWEVVNVIQPKSLVDDEMEEEEGQPTKKEKGKGRA